MPSHIIFVCLSCPGPEQQRPDEAAPLPGVSDHQSGQHGAQRGQEANRRVEETLRCGWWAAILFILPMFTLLKS